MKTIMDLFYETYSPRQKFYGLTMSLKENTPSESEKETRK